MSEMFNGHVFELVSFSLLEEVKVVLKELENAFVRVPAGRFMIGQKGHQNQVILTRDFYLGKFQITQSQWQTAMGNNPSHFKNDPNLPVECVSWNDCQDFIKSLNSAVGKDIFRLPTEVEWEYACRAGSTAKYTFGDKEARLRDYAWYYDNSDNKTHPVGLLKPNAWGFYDMHGNVWEWCQLSFENNPSKWITDLQVASSGIVAVNRGGSYNRFAKYCMAANRYVSWPDFHHKAIGFRLAKAVE